MHATLSSIRRAVRAATPALALGTAVLTAALAACSDGPTSPSSANLAASTRAPVTRGPAYAASSTAASQVLTQTTSGDTVQTTFKLGTNAQSQLVVLGNSSKIVFPYSAASVCDSTAGYGPTLWNAPCRAAAYPITISAKTYHDGRTGKLVSEFHPALRFVPGLAQPVRLYLKDPTYTTHDAIWFCPEGGACVNEAATDPNVATSYDSGNQWVYRILKHFSGYTVFVN